MKIGHRFKTALALGLIVVGISLVGCRGPNTSASPPPAQIPEVVVETVQAQRVTITTELPGRTAAYLVAEVRPQVGGIIQERRFVEGRDVNQGDVLYKVDPAVYQAAYDNAVASLVRSEASLPPIQLKVARYKDAVEAKAVSRQAYDEALAALKQAEADIEYGKAAVQSARINLGYTEVTAPISGRIGKSNVTVGALVSAHQPEPLAVIQQFHPIYVDAPQSSANLLQLKKSLATGQLTNGTNQAKVKLLLEDGTAYPLDGTLEFSDITVDPSTGSFILRMVFPNPDFTLLPGMYVRAVIEEGIVEQGILAPQQSVSRDPRGRPIAFVVDADNKVQQRALTTAQAMGDKWLVTSGLAPGDRVIIEGLQRIRPGAMVKVVPLGNNGSNQPVTRTATQPAPAAK